MSLTVQTITPTHQQRYTDLQSVTVSGLTGDMTILPGHEPMMVQLKIGIIRMRPHTGQTQYFFSQAGMVRIQGREVIITSLEIVHTESIRTQDLQALLKQSTLRLQSATTQSEKEALKIDVQILTAKIEMIKNLQV